MLLIHLQLFYKDKLQKIQISCAVLFFNRYCLATDILSLGWLPIKERTEMRIFNLSYQALHSKNLSKYLKLNFAPKNVCYKHAMIMVRWLKFQDTETPSLQEQLIV